MCGTRSSRSPALRAGSARNSRVASAAAGARIVVGDINDCAETLDLVRQAGGRAIGVRLDVDRRRLGAGDGRGRGAGLRPARRADQQCRALRRAARRPLRRDRRGRVGCLHGGQRQGHLELLQGGGAGDAQGGRRQHRQHRLAGRHLRHAVRAALHDLEGGGDRADPRSGARTRPRPHPRQRAGAERGHHRGHARVLRRQARPRAGDDKDQPDDPAQPDAAGSCPARCCGWSPTRAVLSPARPSRSMAAR